MESGSTSEAISLEGKAARLLGAAFLDGGDELASTYSKTSWARSIEG